MSNLLKFAIACAACAIVTAAEQPVDVTATAELDVVLPTPDEYIKNEVDVQKIEMCHRVAGDFIRSVNFHGYPISVVNVCDKDQRHFLINVLQRLNILGKDVTTMDQLRTFFETRDNLSLLTDAMIEHSLVRFLTLSNVDYARNLFMKALDDSQLKKALVIVMGNQDITRVIGNVLFGDAQIRNMILNDVNLRRVIIRNYLTRAGIVPSDITAQQFRDLVRERPATMLAVVQTIIAEPVLKTLVVHDMDFLRFIATHMQHNSELRTLVFRDVNFARSLLAQSLRCEILKSKMMKVLNDANIMDRVRAYFITNPSFRALFLDDKQFRHYLIRSILVKDKILASDIAMNQIRSYMMTNPAPVLRVVQTMMKDDVLRSLILRDADIVRGIYDQALQDAEIRDAFLTSLRDPQVLQATAKYLFNDPTVRSMIMQDTQIADLMKKIDTTVDTDDSVRAQLRDACKKYATFFSRSIDYGNLKIQVFDKC